MFLVLTKNRQTGDDQSLQHECTAYSYFAAQDVALHLNLLFICLNQPSTMLRDKSGVFAQ